jgi:glycerol-3-phosphate dehydrogenase (NAD(P)+)
MSTDSITVLGAGSWGTALAIRLATNSNDVCLWGHEPAFMEQLARERQTAISFPTSISRQIKRVATDLARAIQHSRDCWLSFPAMPFAKS